MHGWRKKEEIYLIGRLGHLLIEAIFYGGGGRDGWVICVMYFFDGKYFLYIFIYRIEDIKIILILRRI